METQAIEQTVNLQRVESDSIASDRGATASRAMSLWRSDRGIVKYFVSEIDL
jgi:hypothetical protein